jgi:hypothetical protein
MPASVSQIVAAIDAGKSHYATFRKVPTQTTGSGIWFDISMSPGNPVPNYYAAAPTVAIALARSTDQGLNHGPNVTPSVKYLHKFLAMTQTATAIPLPGILLDYLMYYPFVDMSVVDVQPMTTNITLPRYSTGAGVQVMAVEVAGQVGGSQFYITYTNQAGTAGRVSQTVTCNAQTVNGTLVTTAPTTAGTGGPFIPLQAGDSGVRLIESVTFLSGDVGLISLVLVKPIASFNIFSIDAAAEKDYLIDSDILPVINDDAYLNFICYPSGTLASAPINGELHTFWTAT